MGDIANRHPELNLGSDLPSLLVEKRCLEKIDENGFDALLTLIRSRSPRSITYVALGPLTNLALLTEKDRYAMTEMIGRFVAMGGAVDVPGNTSPVAECTFLSPVHATNRLTFLPVNFFADPYAVKRLLLSGSQSELPLDRFILLPLDITTPHELPFPIYKKAVDPPFFSAAEPSNSLNKSPIVHFTSSFLERTREIMLEFGKDAMELHDIVAIWCAICNPPVPDNQTSTGCPLSPGWRARKRLFDIERFF